MAFITAEIKLQEASRALPVRLYFPTDLPAAAGCEVKGVITLLHGMGNTSADWMQYSAAPRYAADNGYILVAPDAENSFYVDMAYGPPWYTILTEWLPRQLQRIFRIPAQRGVNYICGLSMGGYGALRIAMMHPERYAAAGSFSGVLDMPAIAAAAKATGAYAPLLAPPFGPEHAVPQNADLLWLAERTAALPEAERPRLFVSCGAQDTAPPDLLAQNRRFAAAAKDLRLPLAYREWDGVHEWNFWDRSLAEFIGFIQSSGYAEKKRADWQG